jgi:hypothetical protein
MPIGTKGNGFMGKLASKRPLGRNPVIAVRVAPSLHQEIAAVAKAAQRTMSAEMDDLLREALTYRKRFPSSIEAQAVEAMTLAFLLGGANYARDNGIDGPWGSNLEARRNAALAACSALITQFVSSDPQQQALTVEALKGRIWVDIVNRPRPGQRDAP